MALKKSLKIWINLKLVIYVFFYNNKKYMSCSALKSKNRSVDQTLQIKYTKSNKKHARF